MDWKDAPHLFANGKFHVRNDYGSKMRFTGNILGVFEQKNQSIYRIEDYKLLARRIDSLTDEEKEKLLHRGEHHNDDVLFMTYDWELMTTSAFLYLLSIGVYPFDQSHFGKTVIDQDTIE